MSVQEFGGSLSAPGWPEVAHWWRTAPEELRGRYRFLDELIPRGAAPAPRRRAVPTIGFRHSA